VTSVINTAIMADVEEVEVVVAHNERTTLRVGDMFLKIDADQTRTDVEVEAMALAPIPTPQVLWRKPPVLALAALPGVALGCLGEPLLAWAAAGPKPDGIGIRPPQALARCGHPVRETRRPPAQVTASGSKRIVDR
jgi:hypothetical protein